MDPKERMITVHMKERGIKSEEVLDAFKKVDRADFVLSQDRERAYVDSPLSIGHGQTISQPYIVALTVEALKLKKTDRVLELGTGSGFEAAIIAELCGELTTIERIPELADKARILLEKLGYKNITVITGDGSVGYPEKAPYDAIAVSAAAPEIPPSLIEQLAENGRMVIPVGKGGFQELIFLEKDDKGRIIEKKNICDCMFVPLIGKEGFE